MPHEAIWRRNLSSEVSYWESWLATEGLDWPWDFVRRLDPDYPVDDPLVSDHLASVQAPVVTILDVGAGPLTYLGKRYPGKELRITAVDPLAREYHALLERARIEAPVRTVPCRGEDLLHRFGPGSFDLAYARNALDHSPDPLLIIENMLTVIRPSGAVLLRHWKNEGVVEHYEQLHQWNFDVADGDLILWSRQKRHNLSDILRNRAAIACQIEEGPLHAPYVTAVLTKVE